MPIHRFISFALIVLAASALTRAEEPLRGVHKVVFLGDSITYSGQYIADIEATLRLRDPSFRCEFINLGLPSETVSGLTEPGHAGGAFPRPDVHERLERVLDRTKPDLVVACYGMNDGIYYPFGEERFAKYREGMTLLRARAKAAGAKVLHVTPPVFDPTPIKANTLPAGLAEYRKPFIGYNDVLDRYSAWLIDRRRDGWDVVDAHGPMMQYLELERSRDPKFRLADDGVHIDATGHWIIARAILRHWGVPDAEIGAKAIASRPHGDEVLGLVEEKARILRDAYLTATGHKRPGVGAGMAVADAERKAAEWNARIDRLTKPGA
jgi:lysophospholipase L1-like esterase